MTDNQEINSKLERLDENQRRLGIELANFNNRFDTSLLTLSMNVNSLTDAIKNLQEAQKTTNELQHNIILLQERASIIPDMQRRLNELIVSDAANNVVLKGIRFFTASICVSVVGVLVALFFKTNA